MAPWEVVSKDEAGEAPSAGLREIIQANTHLPSRTRQVITQRRREHVEVRRRCMFRAFV